MFKHLQTKFLALLAIMLMGGSYAWAEEVSTLTFTAKCNGSGTADDGVAWTVTSDGSESNFDSTKGIHYGTNSASVQYIQLSTSGISGTITKVVVNASTGSGVTASASVTVGGAAFGGDAQSLSTTATNYTFTGSASGEIVVSVAKPSSATKALYVKSIEVTYTPSLDPSIGVNTNNVQVSADETDGTIIVTYTNFSEVVADVEFYDAEGTTTVNPDTYDWVTAEIDDNNNLYYLIEANEGEARTAYMKVYAVDEDDNEGYSELITITQAAYEAPFVATTYNLASSITSGKHYIIASSKTDGTAQAMGAQSTNNRPGTDVTVLNNAIQTTSEVAEFVICGPDADGNYTIYDAAEGGYLYAASSSSNHLKTQVTLDDNGTWSIAIANDGVATITAQGNHSRNKMRYNTNSSLFSCYSTGQDDVYLYEKADEATPTQAVSISAAGMATFCSENALDFTGLTDMYAYIAQYNNDKVTYRKVSKVPARTGVLLRNPNGGDTSHEVPVLTGAADDVEGNKFIGTLTDINALASVVETNTNYILNNGANGVGFYKANGQKVGAGKAYLQLPTEGAKTFIGFDEEGEATAISTIDNGQLTMDNAYNLQGQKVGSEYKGIVIVNGKKIMVK